MRKTLLAPNEFRLWQLSSVGLLPAETLTRRIGGDATARPHAAHISRPREIDARILGQRIGWWRQLGFDPGPTGASSQIRGSGGAFSDGGPFGVEAMPVG